MYGCERWTIKKSEHWRVDVFELWYWRRLFRVPWTSRRSNQSILKEISPEYSLEGLMLKLKLLILCISYLMWRTDSLENILLLENIEGRRRRGWQRMRWLDGRGFGWTQGAGDEQGGLVFCSSWGHKELDTTEWWTDQRSDRMETTVTEN